MVGGVPSNLWAPHGLQAGGGGANEPLAHWVLTGRCRRSFIRAYRKKALALHPDKGGDPELVSAGAPSYQVFCPRSNSPNTGTCYLTRVVQGGNPCLRGVVRPSKARYVSLAQFTRARGITRLTKGCSIRYDRFGEAGLSESGGMGGGMDPQDLFSQLFGGAGGGFFGGGGGGRPRGPRKGKDLVHRVKVSLEELYAGKVTKLALQKHVTCSKCEGRGGKEGAVKTCSSCNGQGIKVVLRQLGPMVQQMQQTCPDCQGAGEQINQKDKCKACNGKKIVQERKVLEVRIDKGMEDGQQITFKEEADQAPNTIPGDVVIVIDEKPHPRFKRRKNDLFTEVEVDLLTALAGGKIVIEHLDDHALSVEIPAGEVIKPGEYRALRTSAAMLARANWHCIHQLFLTRLFV